MRNAQCEKGEETARGVKMVIKELAGPAQLKNRKYGPIGCRVSNGIDKYTPKIIIHLALKIFVHEISKLPFFDILS